jgi:uncharacterized delta-60 repeat protein
VLAAPVVASARPGALDRGFNGDGKVVTAFPRDNAGRSINYVLPYEFAPGRIAMAPGRAGRVVIASSKAIVVYLGNGRRDPGFGGNGSVPIGPIEGARFQLADIAVDSQGRVLVAGTTKPTEQIGLTGQELPGPLPTVATIRRYQANGQLDPGFGSGGVLSTDLGAPRPTFEGSPYSSSAVAVVGLAVDRQDRPIVTGSAVAEVGRCARSEDRYEASQAIVARLTTSGLPDTSFAGSGIRTIGGLSWLGLPAPTASRIFSVGARTDPCPTGGPDNPSVLAAVGADGAPAGGFSAGGFFSRPFTRISDLAVSPSGKLVLLVRTIELKGGEWVESAGRAIRLRANGSLDAKFGNRGEAQVRLPRRGSISALTTDAKGRVLLAGNVWRRTQGKKGKLHLEFLLIRTTATGEADRDFGRGGRVSTSFGKRMNVRATEVLVDKAGRIAVGGKFSGPRTGSAFALARYLGN